MSRLVIVTATTNYERAAACIASWGVKEIPVIIVANGPEPHAPTSGDWNINFHSESVWEWNKDYLGSVAAFQAGVNYVLDQTDAEIVACLHDDVILQDPDWAAKVLRRFDQQPAIGLLGFGGAVGLGSDDLYTVPYQPMQLARIGFRSNLVDAEVHGIRSLLSERVACLDGFSQIGRREFWQGQPSSSVPYWRSSTEVVSGQGGPRPWDVLQQLEIRHHLYDSLLGAIAARYGWETWFLPIRCRHLGGQTAVGDQGYQRWAEQQTPGGDHGFWTAAHKIGWEAFKDVLPLRV